MITENGNSKKGGSQPTPEAEFQLGRFVCIRRDAFGKARHLTPEALWKIGWPNKFKIDSEVFDDPDLGKCVMLEDCCDHMVNRATGQKRCYGHPIKYFDVLPDDPTDAGPGDRWTSVDVFGLKVIGVEWHEGQKRLIVQTPLFKAPLKLTGEAFKLIADQAKELGVL